MSILSSLSIIVLAALIHASFQLSVSMLTLLSGHAIGSQKPTPKVVRLTSSFVLGAGLMTILLLAFLALVFLQFFSGSAPLLMWAVVCGVMIGVGVAVWAFYYRHEKGTSLWVPRAVARYLSNRTKQTSQSAESFALGMMSVIGELLFVIAPLLVSALVLLELPSIWQLVSIIIYAVVSLMPLFSVWVLIGSGHKLSEIQRWREKNKHFLQFAAGAGLIILGAFVYVYQILGVAVGSV